MELIDESMTEQGLNDLIKMADVDKDGRINYEGILSFPSWLNIKCLLITSLVFGCRVCQDAFVNVCTFLSLYNYPVTFSINFNIVNFSSLNRRKLCGAQVNPN
jgi:hypothetical protein